LSIQLFVVCLPLNIKTHTMNNTKKVSVAEFVDAVKGITRSTRISICYQVDESKSKTKGGKKQLQKQVCLKGWLNHDYQNKVVKLSGDTSFVANPIIGKTPLEGSKTIIISDKTNEPMLYATTLKTDKRDTTYFHNRMEISREDAIQRELFAPSYFKKPTTKGRGLVSEGDDFGLVSPYVSRLLWANIEGEQYEIVK